MGKQRGYINLDGLFAVMAVLAAFGLFGLFGLFGVFALIYWGIPAAWAFVKPWLHAVTG